MSDLVTTKHDYANLVIKFKMFRRNIYVMRLLFLLLSVAIYGAQATGDENLGNTQSSVGTNAKEGAREASASDNWITNLSWNLLGYATIIIPGAFIIRMLKNSNFNERSGKSQGLCMRVLIVNFAV